MSQAQEITGAHKPKTTYSYTLLYIAIGLVAQAALAGIVTVMPKMMNTPLMAKMFGGNIATVMGGSVARDEHAILTGIVRN